MRQPTGCWARETIGVFQLESTMRRVLRELKPSCFEDLIAVLALYRPGPMGRFPLHLGEARQGARLSPS